DRAAMRLEKLIFKEFHLHVETIFDRLNRRKIDLIPTPEWQSPPKSQVRELLAAIEKRLGDHEGIAGLPWLLSRARELALESGLPDPRVTTDLKHIEIGLTDKSDSSRWILENVLIPRKILAHEVCIVGDEFGMAGGVSGSDALLCIPEFSSSAVVSVGVEPAGTPAMVHHVPGGPVAFQDFLDLQLALREWGITKIPDWSIEQTNFDPAREREMEALFSVGNGCIGLRGALEVGIPSSEADLYISGVYDAKSRVLPYSELDFLAPQRSEGKYVELVSFPFPFRIHAKVNQSVLEVREEGSSRHSRRLDLSSGILQVKQEFQLDSLKVELTSQRLASLDLSHRLLHEFELRVSGDRAKIEVDFGVDFNEIQIRHPHLEVLDVPVSHHFAELLFVETKSSGFIVGLGSRIEVNGLEVEGRQWSGWLENGETVKFRRIVVAVLDRGGLGELRDLRILKVKKELSDQLGIFSFQLFHRLIADHRRCWADFWRRADIPFSGNPGLTESQRFNAYHLRSAAPVDSHSSVPARAFSGRGYEGHIFWDTEIFVLPFFALQFPEFARRF
ncbi:glycoside hydrolase family 65 protein, partial [bacterium]|nr:glycoside hydrolase family 65 protein [bacterium]